MSHTFAVFFTLTSCLTAVRDLLDKERKGVSVTIFQASTALATHLQTHVVHKQLMS